MHFLNFYQLWVHHTNHKLIHISCHDWLKWYGGLWCQDFEWSRGFISQFTGAKPFGKQPRSYWILIQWFCGAYDNLKKGFRNKLPSMHHNLILFPVKFSFYIILILDFFLTQQVHKKGKNCDRWRWLFYFSHWFSSVDFIFTMLTSFSII